VTDLIETISKTRFTQTIDGEGVATAYEDVINPATGAPFQLSPAATDAEVDRAVMAARRAQPAWAALSWDERESLIGKLADAIEANLEYLATLNTMEQGMNLPSSRMGTAGTIASLRIIAKVRAPDRVLADDERNFVTETWRPLGVVGAIAPWNGPLILGMQKVVTALIGGNTIVLKPSELTPLATLEVGRLSRGILPPGVFNVIGGGRATGAALVSHPGLDKISFTGSTATGIHIARQSAEFLRPLTLELGGNDAAILMPDGSVEALVKAVVNVGLANRGQFCAAIKRVYVPSAMYDEVCRKVTEAAAKVRIGNGLDPETEMGPIQNKAQFDKICGFVEDAKAAGGKVLIGGEPLPGDGYFYPPTVFAGLKDGVRLVDEEQFGPIVPIIGYDDLDAVIARINSGVYGLTGSIWTADVQKGAEIASRLTVGTGWVNQHGAFDPRYPFPLIKSSGMGMDWADHGVKGTMRLQVVNTLKAA
jgi:acyl-CoA reductase-like NAD-dependent aldehyde dehydrogenase